MSRATGRFAARIWLSEARLWQLALAFLAGNLLLQQLPALPQRGFMLLLATLGLAALARVGFRVATVPAVAVLGLCWTAQAAHDALAARWPAALDGSDVELTGWIDSLPRHDAGRTVFTLRVTAAASDVPLRRVRLSWYEPAPELAAGQTLALEARLRTPRGLVNPGGFDYERWLFVEGLDATGYVRSGADVVIADAGPAQRWLRLRMSLAAGIDRVVADADAAALLKALGLGERGDFADRHWDILQRTGTSHLVAVSGLHIGLIAAIVFAALLRLLLFLPYVWARHAHTLAAVGSLAAAVIYAALAGFALPTQRALVMLLVAETLLLARRRAPVSGGLALALLAVLVFDPLATLAASFWLSFAAVALLLAVASGGRAQNAVHSYVRLQWALTAGLAPLVVSWFGQISLASFFVNLIAIPVFSIVVVPASLLLLLAVAVDIGAGTVGDLAGAISALAWQGLEMAAAPSLSSIDLPRVSPAALWLAVLAVCMAVPRHALPGRRLALLGLAPLFLRPVDKLPPGVFRTMVFDVGHGLAVLIETREHRLLYDAGPLYQSGFDAGAEIVGPAVAALTGEPLDLLVISHADSDHAGGAAAIRERYPGLFVLGGPDLAALADRICIAGENWVWDQVRFDVLHPVAGFVPQGNESSCVVRIEGRYGSLLLTGDIERLAESRLQQQPDIGADVVIVPHHGSLTSSTPGFVAAVGARLAIVSAGFNNRWDFPRAEVVARWQSGGARLLVTGDVGAIDILVDSAGISETPARKRRPRYWRPERDLVSGVQGPSAL